MKTKQTLLSAAVGTTLMTVFSQLVTSKKNRKFTEPEVLSEVIHDVLPDTTKGEARAAGWGTHYAIGLTFAGIYSQVWERTPLKPTIVNGALLGAISGLFGIAGWMQTFKLDPNPPIKHTRRYYSHLLLAHVVFGVGAAMGYRLLNRKKFA